MPASAANVTHWSAAGWNKVYFPAPIQKSTWRNGGNHRVLVPDFSKLFSFCFSSYMPEHINNGSSEEERAFRLSHFLSSKLFLYFENSACCSHTSAGLRLILKAGFFWVAGEGVGEWFGLVVHGREELVVHNAFKRGKINQGAVWRFIMLLGILFRNYFVARTTVFIILKVSWATWFQLPVFLARILY